ncbi:MAG: hypothetical protein IPL21_16025 [Saprospirales bacterium]|nr:hypothetical protein [Saprospirales bacterium]
MRFTLILKKVNTIKYDIDEPIRVRVWNTNDTLALKSRNINSILFYLDIGIHDVTINIDKSIINSNTSTFK